MKILVTGKNGQMGKTFQKIITEHNSQNIFVFVGKEELDFTNLNKLKEYFKTNYFDLIINFAAYTSVDEAENNQKIANEINNLAVYQLAKIAQKQRTKLIHLSSDYVFDGSISQPYKETDKTNPINIYGITKLAAELAIKKCMPENAIIIRTSWLYSEFGNNFVKTMLKIGKERDFINVVSDQFSSPTYAYDLAHDILLIIGNELFYKRNIKTGIYHFSNEGIISWYDFAKEIFKIANLKCKINPILKDEYTTIAKRPRNTVLEKKKIKKKFGVSISDWKKSLKICIKKIEKQN